MVSNLEMKREDPVHLRISLARDGVDVCDRNNSLESKNNKAVGRTDLADSSRASRMLVRDGRTSNYNAR